MRLRSCSDSEANESEEGLVEEGENVGEREIITARGEVPGYVYCE